MKETCLNAVILGNDTIFSQSFLQSVVCTYCFVSGAFKQYAPELCSFIIKFYYFVFVKANSAMDKQYSCHDTAFHLELYLGGEG